MAHGKYQDWITKEGLLKLEGWARDGLTDEQIAYNVGISTSTLYNWKRLHVEILEALKRGKVVVDRQVENALFKRALGYSTTEKQIAPVELSEDEYDFNKRKAINEFKMKHPDATDDDIADFAAHVPKTKDVVVRQVEKDVPPDTTAIIFWLKNRKPEAWRDKQDVNLGGDIGVRRSMKNLTDDELRRLSHEPDNQAD
ncbi:hypothetical protein IWT140_01720 [Secundilactobacillus pentosiphilus]|uniref:Uncharacterized protein n=1 Tax=Secundilactobacillus pentosiphilus TaxID=1714682 RepID=A0A1Z5IQP3_9LACO|nr:hypothetical protein [Secundilactobacillus pentosiphilus]GAX04083.1 hypothetical protein IWT140_01720 [Secundilactobacillus pentosiphilus]